MYVCCVSQVSKWYHSKGAKGRYYLSILNCFGGGVFLGTAVMHLIPEVKDQLDESLLEPYNITYPIAELCIGFGFFLLLFVDKIATIASHNHARKQKKTFKTENHAENGVILKTVYHGYNEADHSHDAPDPRRIGRTTYSNDDDTAVAAATKDAPPPNYSSVNLAFNGEEPATKEKEAAADVTNQSAEVLEEDAELAARPYVFLIALSIDCVFEGMSLGLQDDSYGVWMLVVAILSHELVITFSFGLRLVKLFSAKKTAVIIILYAATIPFGIAVGFAVYETSGSNSAIDITGGIFLGIAAGIFLYITFLEILNEELSHDTYISKPLAVFLGFTFMALMVLMDYLDSSNFDSSDESSSSSSSMEAMTPNMTLCAGMM